MDNHEICRADLAAFLTEMGNNLKKEGWSLQALAKSWFEGSVENDILRATGISIDSQGDQLLDKRSSLPEMPNDGSGYGDFYWKSQGRWRSPKANSR